MTDIQNPTPLSDYDFLEFEGFVHKVKWEGSYSYAAENYAPEFESPEMQGVAADPAKLRAFYRENRAKVDAWYEAVGVERACDLHNAHVDESRKREDDACLWGIRCTDGFVIHERTKESRDRRVAYLQENQGKGWRIPAALLARFTPGGEWNETELTPTA